MLAVHNGLCKARLAVSYFDAFIAFRKSVVFRFDNLGVCANPKSRKINGNGVTKVDVLKRSDVLVFLRLPQRNERYVNADFRNAAAVGRDVALRPCGQRVLARLVLVVTRYVIDIGPQVRKSVCVGCLYEVPVGDVRTAIPVLFGPHRNDSGISGGNVLLLLQIGDVLAVFQADRSACTPSLQQRYIPLAEFVFAAVDIED